MLFTRKELQAFGEFCRNEAIINVLEIIDNLPTTYSKNYSTGIQKTTIEVKELKKKLAQLGNRK